MLKFVLKFLQPVVGKLHEQEYLFVDGFGVANFVGFKSGEVVLLRGLRIGGDGESSRKTRGKQDSVPEGHGCFSGAAFGVLPVDAPRWMGGCSPGLLGNSKCSSSRSISFRSCSTSCMGGRKSSGTDKMTS